MTTHPFPETEPEVTVVPLPTAELREVLRTDAGGMFVPLEVGASATWSFYDWPERVLTNVARTRIVGAAKYRGEEFLEMADKVIYPEEEFWETIRLVRVVSEQLESVLMIRRQSAQPVIFEDTEATPEPLRLRLGDEWTGQEVFRCGLDTRGEGDIHHARVDGVFGVSVPSGEFRCLRTTWWSYNSAGLGLALAEIYVADTGRTIYFRRFNGPAWRNYEELGKAGSRNETSKL